LIEAIRGEIGEKSLYEVSELEQDMCNTNTDDKSGVYSRIKIMIEDPKIKKAEKLKLVILFCLRYEGD
jgi:Sec1 family